MSSNLHPTILLGLDGAAFSIMDALVADGQMPSFGKLMQDGVRAELLSTPHPLTPPAWTTLMTGRQPGSHGIFDFIWAEEREENIYFTLNNFRDIKAETIWSIVNRQGGRVTTLNFPFMSPVPKLNGTVIPGLVSWRHLRRNIHPPEMFEKLKSLPGFHAKDVAWDFEREKQATKTIPPEEYADWVEFHRRRESNWYQIFNFVRREAPAELTAILLDGIDKLQHVCWRQLDSMYADSWCGDFDREVRASVLGFFRELDEFIGQLLQAVGDQARIFIASDHGFGPTEKVFRVNRWLAENGYLTWRSTDDLDEHERAKIEKLINGHFVHLDWDRTTAYAQSSATNGIHIRVASAPGESGVPLEEYESFRDQLAEQLLQIRDPETGQQIVTKVLKREEVFPGAHNQRCPDLTLILFDYGFISTLNQAPVIYTRPGLAGTHRPEGIFLAHGPGIPRGEVLPQQSILDVAPTLLHSLGLPIPVDFEGAVIDKAFDDEFMTANPVRVSGITESPGVNRNPAERPQTDDMDDEAIVDRLRALGYVE